MIAIAGLVGVPYAPTLIITLLLLQALLAFTLTAFGLMIAVRITQLQAFMAITQMFVMPLFFVAGAIFPVSGLPGWLAVLNRIDPLTYAIDPMRHAVFEHLDVNSVARRALDPGVTWGTWHVPPVLEAAIVFVLGLSMLLIAIVEFSRSD